MKKSFVTPILKKIARELGVRIEVEPRYQYAGRFVLADGSYRYFRGTNIDINPLGASEIAQDKDYAQYFLQASGYPVPKSQAFLTRHWSKTTQVRRSVTEAVTYAQRLGWPVIVKPNSKSQGFGVTKVYNAKELRAAVKLFEHCERVFLVQQIAPGHDYRVVVLDDEVISAYERLPLTVVGDGRSTVQQLLNKRQREFRRVGRDTVLRLDDPRMAVSLRRLRLTKRSVLRKGLVVQLLDNANLSTGGEALDVTDEINPEFAKLCVKITRDMGLRLCGVDVIVEGDIREAPDKYIVLEINAAPGLDNYAAMGKTQQRRVESLYRKVLKAVITLK